MFLKKLFKRNRRQQAPVETKVKLKEAAQPEQLPPPEVIDISIRRGLAWPTPKPFLPPIKVEGKKVKFLTSSGKFKAGQFVRQEDRKVFFRPHRGGPVICRAIM